MAFRARSQRPAFELPAAAVRDAGLGALADALASNQTVRTLNLAGCKDVSDAAAARMLRTLDAASGIQALTVAGCTHVGDAFAAQRTAPSRLEAVGV